jgi:hypothetical protein
MHDAKLPIGERNIAWCSLALEVDNAHANTHTHAHHGPTTHQGFNPTYQRALGVLCLIKNGANQPGLGPAGDCGNESVGAGSLCRNGSTNNNSAESRSASAIIWDRRHTHSQRFAPEETHNMLYLFADKLQGWGNYFCFNLGLKSQ